MSRNTGPGYRIGTRKRPFTDQAHPDPSLGRLRPRSVPHQTIRPEHRQAFETLSHQLNLIETEPVNPEPPRWMKRVDAGIAIAIVFLFAVYVGSRLIANAACGI